MSKESKLERVIRQDLRAIREAAGISQEAVGEIFGWERAAVSKLELGYTKVKLADYLRIVDFCRDAIQGHPALALAEHYAPRPARNGTPYTAPAE